MRISDWSSDVCSSDLDGSGRGVPIITTYARKALAFAQNSRGELRLESGHGQIAGALSTGGGKPGQGMPMVLSVALRGRDHGIAAELGGALAPALRASSGGGDRKSVGSGKRGSVR